MSRWFRHYAGMMRDEKLVRVAVKAKQPVERVVWVWGAILESAAEVNDGGRYEFDTGEAAYFLRCDEDQLVHVLQCLEDFGRVRDGVVIRWSDRQFDSDSSRERQRRYRERQKAGGDVSKRNRDVRTPSRDVEMTLQEAETETDTDTASSEAASCASPDLDPTVLENKMRGAAGDKIQPAGGFIVGPVMTLISLGADVELDVLPTIRRLAARLSRPANSWEYFVPAIQDAMDKRKAAGTWERAPPGSAPGQKPPSPAMVRHQRIRQDVKREIDGDRNAEPAGLVIELPERDFRSH